MIHTKLTVINSEEVGSLLRRAVELAKEEASLPMLLAIAFEYALLTMDATPEERAKVRKFTIEEAERQAASFWEVAHRSTARPSCRPGPRVVFKPDGSVSGDMMLDVLDWVLEEQIAGRRPTDLDVAKHFNIPVEQATAIHDALEKAGEFG